MMRLRERLRRPRMRLPHPRAPMGRLTLKFQRTRPIPSKKSQSHLLFPNPTRPRPLLRSTRLHLATWHKPQQLDIQPQSQPRLRHQPRLQLQFLLLQPLLPPLPLQLLLPNLSYRLQPTPRRLPWELHRHQLKRQSEMICLYYRYGRCGLGYLAHFGCCLWARKSSGNAI